jgi:hypothetical protein
VLEEFAVAVHWSEESDALEELFSSGVVYLHVDDA